MKKVSELDGTEFEQKITTLNLNKKLQQSVFILQNSKLSKPFIGNQRLCATNCFQ
jgi:hypothetical protein